MGHGLVAEQFSSHHRVRLCRRRGSLPLDAFDMTDVVYPRQCGTMPNLARRLKLCPLLQRTNAYAIYFGFVWIGRVERCSAVAAESLRPPVAVVGRFDVDLGNSGSQREISGRRKDTHAEGGTAERLAIRAMTDPHRIGVYVSFKGYLSAMTTAVDFH